MEQFLGSARWGTVESKIKDEKSRVQSQPEIRAVEEVIVLLACCFKRISKLPCNTNDYSLFRTSTHERGACSNFLCASFLHDRRGDVGPFIGIVQ